MKKFVAVCCLFAVGLAAAGAQDIAIGPLVAVNATSRTIGNNSASRSTVTIGAMVPILLDGGMELTPELSFTFFTEKDVSNTIPGYAQELQRFDFSFGAGAYWSLAKTSLFTFKSGGQVLFTLSGKESGASAATYESYFYPEISLGAPLIMDLNLNRRFAVRIHQPIAYLSWGSESEQIAGVKETNASFQLATFYTGLLPRFAFLIKL